MGRVKPRTLRGGHATTVLKELEPFSTDTIERRWEEFMRKKTERVSNGS